MTTTQETIPGTPPSRGRRRSKQDNMFGPYSLLYTIGEGEFAKVKYGLHSETGSESAIKLIRKENVDAEKLSKIKREISVLKSLNHPYIVKLVEVIETQNYIGIVLEFASGGELFDHILAHRYLKEREASRLFAQLICGVDYLHRNKIIHRDLKLENLLLDRNRNIIITDFGFANQFGKHGEDLMATSCGSPCYAAPELVVSDGMYVGSAVDVWSCGVILYAMLAGFLPYDDDPANPEGDNINLLYKYILSTPLSFPEYIGSDARDLLRRMLVPDPAKRCKVKDIMNHRWLASYKGLFEEFKLKAKLEFVTGTPVASDNNDNHPPDVSTKPRRQNPSIESSPFSCEKAVVGKGLLDSTDSEPGDSHYSGTNPTKNPSHCTLESRQDAGNNRTSRTATDLGISVPLDPFDPSAVVSASHQALSPFDPTSAILCPGGYEKQPTEQVHRFSRKDNPSSSSLKTNKARPVSMQTAPANAKKSAGRPSCDASYERSGKGSNSNRKPSRSQNERNVRMAPMTPTAPIATTVLSSEQNDSSRQEGRSSIDVHSSSDPRRRNRQDTRKAMSALVDSAPASSSGHPSSAYQNNLVPPTNTAQKISDWIKRKSVVMMGGSVSDVPPSFATPDESVGRTSIALPRESFNIPRDSDSVYKLRYHRGAVDQFALTSRDPSVVISEVKSEIISMGFTIEKSGNFKLKILRPSRSNPGLANSSGRKFTLVGLRDLLQILPRNNLSASSRGSAQSHPTAPDSLYGEPSIDNGEEMSLSLELCKIRDFPNLYSLDIKRIRGNIWSYKFLYHFILERLQLNSNGGYLNP